MSARQPVCWLKRRRRIHRRLCRSPGNPSELEGYKTACVIGGGVGTAIAYPSAKALYEQGAKVDVIAGFRSKDIVILEDEFRACSDNLYITTDDGTYGRKGFVTQQLTDLLESGKKYDVVVAIGPVIVMKLVSDITREYGIKTLVSLNPIMVDGTGMRWLPRHRCRRNKICLC